MKNEEVIEELVRGHQKVELLPPTPARTLRWGVGAFAAVALVTALVGPFRPGFLAELLSEPQFLLETISIAAVSLGSAYTCLRLSIPYPMRGKSLALALLLLWVALLSYSFFSPALLPSMRGKRPYCLYEILLYSIPLLMVLRGALKKGAPFARGPIGLAAGLAAAAAPAFVMQLACMYAPTHNFLYHFLPVPIIGVVGLLLVKYSTESP